MKIGQLLSAFLTLACGSALAADPLDNWQSIELGQSGDLTVRLRVKERTSLADEEWIAIEFENRGKQPIEIESAQYHTSSVRHDLKTGGLVSSGSLSSGNDYDLFPEAWKTTPVAPRVVKPGLYRMIDHPSLYSSALLGLPKENGLRVKAKISLSLRVNNELVQWKGHRFEFEWRYPTETEFEQMRTRLKYLLVHPRDYVQHAYILHTLLEIPQVADATTAKGLLAAIGPRTHSFSGREYVLRHLNEHYATDKTVVDFFLQRLINGDKHITSDLRRAHDIWTPEFLPPLMQRYERYPTSIHDVFEILRLQGTPQKTDAKLAARLSRALHGWDDPVDADQRRSVFIIGDRLALIGQTHDRKMIPKLAPYLDDERTTLDPTEGASFNFRIPPLRVCDYALEATLRILDGGCDAAYKEAGLGNNKGAGFDIRSSAPRNVINDFDEINKIRDKMIVTLKQRLAK